MVYYNPGQDQDSLYRNQDSHLALILGSILKFRNYDKSKTKTGIGLGPILQTTVSDIKYSLLTKFALDSSKLVKVNLTLHRSRRPILLGFTDLIFKTKTKTIPNLNALRLSKTVTSHIKFRITILIKGQKFSMANWIKVKSFKQRQNQDS